MEIFLAEHTKFKFWPTHMPEKQRFFKHVFIYIFMFDLLIQRTNYLSCPQSYEKFNEAEAPNGNHI